MKQLTIAGKALDYFQEVRAAAAQELTGLPQAL